jgi:hypothetical protein
MKFTNTTPGPGLGGAGSNALWKTFSVVLCVLEQPRADNSSTDLNGNNWSNGIKAGPAQHQTYENRRTLLTASETINKLNIIFRFEQIYGFLCVFLYYTNVNRQTTDW